MSLKFAALPAAVEVASKLCQTIALALYPLNHLLSLLNELHPQAQRPDAVQRIVFCGVFEQVCGEL